MSLQARSEIRKSRLAHCQEPPRSTPRIRLLCCRTLAASWQVGSGKPIIVSPNSKEIFLVSKKTIPLRAKADADVREIFWFAGKQFVGKAAPNQVLEWTAAAGDYEVTALDDHGRAGSHSVVVR